MDRYIDVKLSPIEIGKLMKKIDSTITWMERKKIEEAKIASWREMFNALGEAAWQNGTPIAIPKKG